MWPAKHNIIKWNEHKQCGALVPLALSSLFKGQQMKVRFSFLLDHMCESQSEKESDSDRKHRTECETLRGFLPKHNLHITERREVLLCALYKAWTEIPSLSKYYYRQQFPTEFNVETQRVRLGDHAPESHLKTSFHSHTLQPAHPPWYLHLYKINYPQSMSNVVG